jgi:hypothetical protein
MCALPRVTAVTSEYQRDSSSKRHRSSVVSAARPPTRASPTECQTAGVRTRRSQVRVLQGAPSLPPKNLRPFCWLDLVGRKREL